MVTIDYRLHVGNFLDRGVNSASRKEWFSKFNAIFAWLDLKDLHCGLSVLQQSETAGAFLPNPAKRSNVHAIVFGSLKRLLGFRSQHRLRCSCARQKTQWICLAPWEPGHL